MKNNPKSYRSDKIEVSYDVTRCIHAAECTRGLPAVFDTSRRPWIQPEGADPDAIAAVIHKCPTGALHYTRSDGGAAEAIPARNSVKLDPNGPVLLRGDLQLVDATGEVVLSDTRIALCRCGASKNKPFCDNSHKDIDWKGEVTVAQAKAITPDAQPTGKFQMQPFANGPVVSQGSIAVLDAQGNQTHVLTNPAFCRCGGSVKKPFCDGTHKTNGFKSE